MTLPIHRHLAEVSNQRLDFVKRCPNHISLIGADADISRTLLAKRYPQATFNEYDAASERLQQAHNMRKTPFWQKLTGKTVAQHQQPFSAPLPAATADMLWANLALIRTDEPTAIFDNWSNHLHTDGLLFFTHFGIDSLHDLLTAMRQEGIEYEAPLLLDMHDLGDMLFHHGFYDPVMDTAKIELQYTEPATFWQDMHDTGLWQSLRFHDEAAARQAAERILRSANPPAIMIETVYGHALKKMVLPEGEQAIQFFPTSNTKP